MKLDLVDLWMVTLFWDNVDLIYLEKLPSKREVESMKNLTIIRDSSFDTLIRLKQVIKVKHPKGIVVLHNNARPILPLLSILCYINSNGKYFDTQLIRITSPFWFSHDSCAEKRSWKVTIPEEETLKKEVNELFLRQDSSWCATGIEKLITRFSLDK